MRTFHRVTSLVKAKLAFPVFRLAHKFLSEKGLDRFFLIRRFYEFLYRRPMPKEKTLVLVENVRINLPGSNSLSSVTAHPLMHGVWRGFQTKLFNDCIHRGMVIVDIGAHIRYYTLLAANLTGEEEKVFAGFKP